MAREYSVETYRELEQEFQKAALHRPRRIKRYEAGTELEYEVTGVADANRAVVRLVIDKFVGGGFAGQVYRVKILDVQSGDRPVAGIEPGKLQQLWSSAGFRDPDSAWRGSVHPGLFA